MVKIIRDEHTNRFKLVKFSCRCGCAYKTTKYKFTEIANYGGTFSDKYKVRSSCPQCTSPNFAVFDSFDDLEDSEYSFETGQDDTIIIKGGAFNKKVPVILRCGYCDTIMESDEYHIQDYREISNITNRKNEPLYKLTTRCASCNKDVAIIVNAKYLNNKD